MFYRIASLLASEAANTATTKTIDINVAKPISRIIIQFKGTNSTNVPVAHPQKMITKVELVDGSNILYSLSGIEARALNYYERGVMPYSLVNFNSAQQCSAIVEMNFGRWLWDEMLAFDPKKYSNPQLKITHNLAAGGSTPTTATMNVFAFVFDQKTVSPTGFLMSKEQYGYTLVASANEKIDLATDMPYRKLLINSLAADKAPYQQYNVLKLSEDNDQVVVINGESTSDLIKLLQDLPFMTEQIDGTDLDAIVTMYCTPTYNAKIFATAKDVADTALYVGGSNGGTFLAKNTNGQITQFLATGLIPHGALEIPFGDQKNPTDWYDVSKVGSLALTITAGSGASGTVEIVSQQLKSYAK